MCFLIMVIINRYSEDHYIQCIWRKYQSNETTELQTLHRAQHTVTISSINTCSLPDRSVTKSIGKVPLKIGYFCRTHPITHSTWILTLAVVRVFSTSSAVSCFLRLVKAGICNLAWCIPMESAMLNPRSAKITSPGVM